MTLPMRLSTSMRPARLCFRCLRASIRYSSTDAPASPILTRLRDDLKTAMRAKDQKTLPVIRSILADITNMSKTPSPVNSDMSLRALLVKKASAARTAIEEFQNAKREDLVEKESATEAVLQRYVGEIEESMGGVVSREDMQAAVKKVIDAAVEGEKVVMGKVMTALLGPGGDLEGKVVDKKELSGVVSEALKK